MVEMGFIEKIKGFMLQPADTYQKLEDEPLSASITYFVILLVPYSLLSSIFITMVYNPYAMLTTIPGFESYESLVGSSMENFCVLGLLIAALVGGLLSLFVGGAIIHLGVLLMGGKKGYSQTVKSIAYGNTAVFLFGWIPFITIIFSIWTLIITIFGIKELHNISTGRAVIAVFIIPLIIFVIIGCIIAATAFAFITGLLGTMGG